MEGIFIAHISDYSTSAPLNSKKEYERNAVVQLLHHLLPGETLAHSPEGAPYLERNSCAISVSHSGDFVALYLHSSAKQIGMDLETKFAQVLRIAPRFMNKEELESLSSLSSTALKERWAATVWCAKEAAFKYYRTAHPDFRTYYHTIIPAALHAFCLDESVQTLQIRYLYPSPPQQLAITIKQHKDFTLAHIADVAFTGSCEYLFK